MADTRLKWEPIGDSAFQARCPAGSAASTADRVLGARLEGVLDVVAAFDVLAVYVDPIRFEPAVLDAIRIDAGSPGQTGRLLHVPVCYEFGEDTQEVCSRLGIAVDDLVQAHTGSTLDCMAIGFCPGFPYLAELAPELAGLPRKAAPVPRVEPGTVAVMGNQCGIYTLPRPGGWWRIGRTPLTLVDVDDDYFPVSVGDRVQFEAVDLATYESLLGKRL